MKVTFIQPYYHNIWEAIGVGYIAAYCKKDAPDVEYNFYQSMFDSDDTIIKGSTDSDIVAFSCTSPSFKHGIKLASTIKALKPSTRIVFGGNHVSALKEKVLERNSVIDQIVIGEGEKAFLNIMQGEKSSVIPGCKIDFDELPWVDRELIKNYRTIDLCEKMAGIRVASFQSNRVCPFRCAFCAERAVTGVMNRETNPIRTRDVSDTLSEIESVIDRYNINYFKFVDATFDVSSDYVISFCKEKINRGINTYWECMIHASFVSEEMFLWLKRANCNQVDIGCESGSPKVLKQMKKGVTLDKIKSCFQLAKKHDIKRRAFFILGTPDETQEDYDLTEKLIDEIKPDVVGFTILCPYPGTDLYTPELGNIDWSTTDEYSNDFWRTNNFTNKDLKMRQRYFTVKYEDSLCERQEGNNEN